MLLNGVFDRPFYFDSSILIFIGIASFGLRRLVDYVTSKKIYRFILSVLWITIFSLIPLLLSYSLVHLIFLCILAALVSVTGRILGGYDAEQFLSTTILIWVWAINSFFTFCCHHLGYEIAIAPIIISLLALLFSRLFIANWENIDALTTKRGHTLNDLPKQLRKHHVILVCSIFSLILFLFLVSKPLAKGLNFLISLAGELVRKFLAFLLSFIDSSEVSAPPAATPPPAASSGGFPVAESQSNPIVTMIFNILGYALFIAIIIGILFLLFKNLPRFIAWIVEKFKNSGMNSSVIKDENEAWTMVEKKIKSKKNARFNEKNINISSWRKDYKKYLKTKQADKSFHLGYQLAICGLRLSTANISYSDTPSEIAEKAKSLLTIQNYGDPTNQYNSATYGEDLEILGDCQSLDIALSEINQALYKQNPTKKILFSHSKKNLR